MSQMLSEAQEAPDRIEQLLSSDANTYTELSRRLRELNPVVTATVARGSSDHAATYASYLIPCCTGKLVASIPPSLVSVLNAPLRWPGQFVLAISQSGCSPDITATVAQARKSGALTAAIVNDPGSPVAALADVVLPQYAGREGIAATKSVLCSFAAVARLAAGWADNPELIGSLMKLPAVLRLAFQAGMQLDVAGLQDVSSAYVLSRGLGLSAALEIALKLKETCGIHAEAFSSAEVRHGPREIVTSGFMVIALALPGPGREDVLRVAEELKEQGARTLIIDLAALQLECDSRLGPLVALQMIYPWLARSAGFLGHDPDRPRNLKEKVVRTI